MTKYVFRVRLPVEVDENALRRELARMMHELITQRGEIQIDVGVKYKLNEYEVDSAWRLE
ncbi:MAG: hypothetical protein JZD41_07880 [Thermoproteus sp.]|nr:hypothetical protein [Thermoproteus sp.]